MSFNEMNHEEWKELRSRVDSLANTIFVLSGGAITLSATALVQLKSSKAGLPEEVVGEAVQSWVSLLAAIMLFSLLKVHLIGQAYARANSSRFYTNTNKTNLVGWGLGLFGVSAFFLGLSSIVYVASKVITA
ncbi:hypothetical protein [Saccharospirillum salsuginis]|uniref:Uncharacterized protein n=1 Tax=Saccharospirillum salsuginis TaxID=418750 RepID=A0A918K0J8_9GAMM|nr:hypothetical protein [Saccharospirillum salsuginis]GGX39974.1 hypothetical protein GCM10007392_03180 [Saccharospirillum salsuginis]